VAFSAGRHEEGVALLRNALVAAELNELDDPLGILSHLGILSPIPCRMTRVTLPHTVTSHYKEI